MHNGVHDWVVQTQWLHAQSTSSLLIKHAYKTTEAACNAVKGGRNSKPGGDAAIWDCVFPWTICRWGETTLANGSPLINIPELTTQAIDLVYIEEEVETLKAWIRAEKEHAEPRYNSALYDCRLVSFHEALPGTERCTVSGKSVFREAWDKSTFKSSPVFQWLEDTLVPTFEHTEPALAVGETSPPHKAVLFAPLPSQTCLVNSVSAISPQHS